MHPTPGCGLLCNQTHTLIQDDYNVVVVDWNSKSWNYIRAASNTRASGAFGGLIMQQLVESAGASYGDIWCVGHSLGSHFCGFAGRQTGGQIGRITGLQQFSFS